MNIDALSLEDFLVLRASAQRFQEKYECDLRQCSESMRAKNIEKIINLDMAISRCNRRENSFTPAECKLLIAAVEYYRGILPQSSQNAHLIITILLEKLAAYIFKIRSDNMPIVYSNNINDSILTNS